MLFSHTLDCSQSSIFRKIIEIESFALRATHLAWVSKLPRGWGRFVAVTVRRGISKRSHEKIGDCEQSTLKRMQPFVGKLVTLINIALTSIIFESKTH